jgi:glycosyltransferase involved in cell wall biosynthesis
VNSSLNTMTPPLTIVHLAASPFFGGPERQMLGLARHLPGKYRSIFLSFAERGKARPFLHEVREHGFRAIELRHNFPRLARATREVQHLLHRLRADIVCCHGYKSDLVGWHAARRVGIPVVAVSHGWTGATLRVRFYETLDRWVLRRMDVVVGVSAAQAEKVRHAGVPAERVVTIRNAIGDEAFAAPDSARRERLQQWFASPPKRLVCAIGRLSPEKGFDQLVTAAQIVSRCTPDACFLIIGDGPLRETLRAQIADLKLTDRVALAGFHADAASFLAHCDIAVLPSYTEGLPVVLLEAFAAGVPVAATNVGGIPEVVEDGVNGFLVPPGNAEALAERICRLLHDDDTRRTMGRCGHDKVREGFTFAVQAEAYQRLFDSLAPARRRPKRRLPVPVHSWL